MLHPSAPPRPVRVGAALAGVVGLAGLSGCASSGAQAGAPSEDIAYTDGTYTAEGSYRTPETTETIEVTITLADDVITAVEVVGDPQAPQSVQYQGRFIGGISDEVVGRDIDEISVSRVAGSSLTSGGFNDALETIKAEAAA
ncbi:MULTISPECIES: hypothetical protein [Microbacterium]|uniref:FMN-binding domain-containing protein n=1 Tax=Microbacterium wangchenii TaxID=2541726 RepID=A0ABX5SU96_9MICO|nr:MULTISPECIES: hypothetical protein [Microbacterium]MCK6067714.1 hypothetical protein [Microbacterium sp. EYE_512]QBR89372.1 hypothetical protein E4K62_12205 [Microbacterium wangchenii]TXK11045.1 hypothetical protein FVP99_17275 [Microbacterium wangchenii]